MTTYFKLRMPVDLGSIDAGSYVIVECVDDGIEDGLSFELRFDTVDDLLRHKGLQPQFVMDSTFGSSDRKKIEK